MAVLAQLDEAVSAAGKLTESGVVAILMFFIICGFGIVGFALRYLFMRLLNKDDGLLTIGVSRVAAAMERLPIAVSENTEATRKVDSHVVKIVARMDHTGKQIRDFARMWRHNIDTQRAIARHLGVYEQVAAEMDRMEQLADRIIVDDVEDATHSEPRK